MKSTNLTKRQQVVLQYVLQFIQAEGRSPTLKEIADGVGSRAVSTVHKHVLHLIEKGFIERSHGAGNNITLAELAAEDERGRQGGPSASRIVPFCGDVAAGSPLIPEERAIPIEVPPCIHREKGELFVLRVRGDSMIEDNILDGDLVVLQRRGEYRNGERVVALLDGEEVTLKEFQRRGHDIVLIPHNPTLTPKRYSPENIEIQGVLVGVMRSC